MQLYYPSPQNEAQIAEIRRTILLSMNGVVADKMKESGLSYKINYGVTIPRLKEIATAYKADHNLAHGLWILGVRETMILATMLEPVSLFTIEDARKRIAECKNIEITEQICINLLGKLSCAPALCLECVMSDETWHQTTGFLLAARVYKTLDKAVVLQLINRAFECADTDEYHLYRTIATCLGRFCRIDNEILTTISNRIASMNVANKSAALFIAEEVKQEIKFLADL